MLEIISSVIGCIVVSRTIDIFIEKSIIKPIEQLRRVLIWANLLVGFYLLCGFGPIILAFVAGASALSPILLLGVRHLQNKKRFRDETVELYQELLLEVLAGGSIRSAVEKTLPNQKWSLEHRELAALVLSGRESNLNLRSTQLSQRFHELHSLLNGRGSMVNKIKLLKERWMLSKKLERKRQAATALVQAQSILTLFLFAGVVVARLVVDLDFLKSLWLWSGIGLLILGLYLISRFEKAFQWKQ